MPGKNSKYSNISVNTELVLAVRTKIKKLKLGYTSVAKYVEESIRQKLKEE